MLKVKNVEKYYGSKNNVTKALDRVSFDVADGEFIAIMGASGSGKTADGGTGKVSKGTTGVCLPGL